ncbi:MAG: adenylosuccinate lyase [Chloroflexota bacterium]|nr:MAG: adenylosuccinate lyase [Chloroflexota bacterium]
MIERYTLPDMAAIWSEKSKLDKWLAVEIAACEGWAALGVVPESDLAKIRKAHFDLARVEEIFERTHHDMTAFLASVAESLGEESRFVHMGMTSSDVMDTATALQLVDSCDIIARDLERLDVVLRDLAQRHKYTVMVGRTHGVHAEPITFGLKLAGWVAENGRNQERLRAARAAIAVGKMSGAVGTYATIPPAVEEHAMARLGLVPAPVSTQIVQRDRHAQLVTTLALVAASLEKFATELRALQRTEVLEVEEPFSDGQTGSSAMPHKRNPELGERICGLARVIRGHAVTALENVALWHERDISHSSTERIILPDGFHLLHYMLHIFTKVMAGLLVYPEHMRENLDRTQGLVFSQRILTTLLERGLVRQQAYALVQRNAMRTWKEKVPFLQLLQQDADVTAIISPDELTALFDVEYYTRHVDAVFRRVGLS